MFIQIIQGRCTKQDEMRAMADRWRAEVAPGAEGWLGGTYGFTDDDLFVGVVRFESQELAAANSRREQQGQWWAETEKLFDGPVEFHDCSTVLLMMDGGSDDAGFVQVIRGRVRDADALRSMLSDQQMTSMMHEARPEIIGATLAIEDDGTFTETVAFTDEQSARLGEQHETSAEMAQGLDEVVKDASFLDLHRPWFGQK